MKDLLKFITCGSVDDGKSTLIGHILYDSKLLYADQERALALDSKVGSRGGAIDYSLLLDGLTEEREQGITIDVAYRYFTTDARSFIVADTPGHEEYTRNMAVGASFADLSIILIDAQKGVLVQTRRHARICSIMGIRHFVFAVNKMDLVSYSESRFREIEEQIRELAGELSLPQLQIIPVSATEGDNVTHPSEKMGWYTGDVLLPYLERVDVDDSAEEAGFTLPVQRVSRPDHSFRGFQGQIESGSASVGDELTALPSKETARISRILVAGKDAERAQAGQPVTIALDREIDVSRGSVLTSGTNLKTADSVTATLLWMDDAPLVNGKSFFVKLGTRLIPGLVAKILYSIDINTGVHRETDTLSKNEIAVCRLSFTDRIVVDRFQSHKALGELILIDRISFMTSACGVVEQLDQSGGFAEGKVTAKTRAASLGQQAVTVAFSRKNGITREVLEEAERKLILAGRHTYLLDADAESPEADSAQNPVQTSRILDIASHLGRAGIVVLLLTDDALPAECRGNAEHAVLAYAKEENDAESIASFVRNVSSFDFDFVGEAGGI